ncbi:MAG: DUF4404 family protein [Bacteroidota bacterium]|jgi:hypothetical protein
MSSSPRHHELSSGIIKKIKSKIQKAAIPRVETKKELLDLISKLEHEVADLSKDDPENAESIIGFIERSTHEATRRGKNEELLKISLAGLTASVKGFEASHEPLVAVVNNICAALANMGI